MTVLRSRLSSWTSDIRNAMQVRRGDMRCPRALLVALLVAGVFLGACGGDDASSGDTTSTTMTSAAAEATDGATVTMKLIAFKPDSISVAAGTSVTWKQTDPGVHTVTSGTVDQGTGGVTEKPDGTFDSGNLETGKTFSFTFAEPGTYSYFCAVHPATMRGRVQVS
jgi:plastocyanin